LGLSIVKHITNRHNGKLSIKSKVDKGSTFTISLPVFQQTVINP
jgi:signal transduction histidine kinase